jgi:hypothetical protein
MFFSFENRTDEAVRFAFLTACLRVTVAVLANDKTVCSVLAAPLTHIFF